MYLLKDTVIIISVVFFNSVLCNVCGQSSNSNSEEPSIEDKLLEHIETVVKNAVQNEDNMQKSWARVKRQSSSKFSEASQMSQLKALRLYLQMAKNFVTGTDIGGIHPMSPNVPKPIVLLIKSWIFAFLFPEVGGKVLGTEEA